MTSINLTEALASGDFHKAVLIASAVLAAVLAFGILGIFRAGARNKVFYVAPSGNASNDGTLAEPWDIISALDGSKWKQIRPGSTLYLRSGVYKAPCTVMAGSREHCHGFPVSLHGLPDVPIKVMPYRREHVVLDGGLCLGEGRDSVSHVWFYDFEILVSEPRAIDPADSIPAPVAGRYNTPFPWGGVTVQNGTGAKIINFVIHDNSQGIGWWTWSKDSEVYGTIIYDNGWYATDRPHGHGVYAQNNVPSVKTMEDCILLDGVERTLLYIRGSAAAHLKNFIIQHNVFCTTDSRGGLVLIGGDSPVENIRLIENYFSRTALEIGNGTCANISCQVTGNIVDLSTITVDGFPDGGSIVSGNSVHDLESGARPTAPLVVVRRNKYDPDRAHIIIYLFEAKQRTVAVNLSEFLEAGNTYKVMNPKNMWGQPILQGRYTGEPLEIPLNQDFAALVLFRM